MTAALVLLGLAVGAAAGFIAGRARARRMTAEAFERATRAIDLYGTTAMELSRERGARAEEYARMSRANGELAEKVVRYQEAASRAQRELAKTQRRRGRA